MELEEIRNQKRQLELSIRKAITEFENITDTRVLEILMDSDYPVMIGEHSITVRLESI